MCKVEVLCNLSRHISNRDVPKVIFEVLTYKWDVLDRDVLKVFFKIV